MKIQTIIYVNKEDPRLFVYKHQKWKWVGVTLNFAHLKSFPILIITLASVIVPLLPVLFVRNGIGILLLTILFVLWLIALTWYYYLQAAKDLQRYPGNLSVR